MPSTRFEINTSQQSTAAVESKKGKPVHKPRVNSSTVKRKIKHKRYTMEQSDAVTGQQHRQSVGIRPILHAARIFDPDYLPTPIDYQLHRRSRTMEAKADIPVKHTGRRHSSVSDEEQHRGRSVRAKCITHNDPVAAARMNTDYQASPSNFPAREATPSDDTREDSLSYQRGVPFEEISADIDSALRLWEASFIHEGGDMKDPLENSSSHLSNCSSDVVMAEGEREENRKGIFAVTEEERELLDYEGIRGRCGNDALYICTERAVSMGPKEFFDKKCQGDLGRRWSL